MEVKGFFVKGEGLTLVTLHNCDEKEEMK